MSDLSDEYANLQSVLLDVTLERKVLKARMVDNETTYTKVRRRMEEIEAELQGRVQQSLFDD